MTSRARRIVLAMYGHTKPVPAAPPVRTVAEIRAWLATQPHSCYEAMDDLDDVMPRTDSSGAWIIPPAPRVLVGGNFGLPCA